MRFQARRGVSAEFPENTMAAYRAAAAQHFDSIAVDPAFTVDDQCVLLKDRFLNRTCVAPDGSFLKEPVELRQITLQQAQAYDAGRWKAARFAGERIPSLQEVLRFAAQANITVKLDARIEDLDAPKREQLFSLVEASGARVAFGCKTAAFVGVVAGRFPRAEIHYDGTVDEAAVRAVCRVLQANPLTVWLPIASPDTEWVNLPHADEALCRMVRQHAQLGLWGLSTEQHLQQAEAWQADWVETAGELKPVYPLRGMVDCHCHTAHSHDGTGTVRELCEQALAQQLSGVTITDHCDTRFCMAQDVIGPIAASTAEANRLKAEYAGHLKVLTGVELGEPYTYPAVAKQVTALTDYDVVLGSVHMMDQEPSYATIDFSAYTPEQIDDFLTRYFRDMLRLIAEGDFDVLTHLTCPLRYITGKYGIAVDLDKYPVGTILKEIVRRRIALEVNTSCLGSGYDTWMPTRHILNQYRYFGGYLITLASDAHNPQNVGREFRRTRALLRELGFRHAYYYENRVPIPYSLEETQECSTYDVTALGEILIDFVPDGTDADGDPRFVRKAGGAPLNVLATVAKFGGSTAFIGKVGADMFGRHLARVLEQYGIESRGLAVDSAHNTTMAFVALSENGQREFSFCRNYGADVMLQPWDVDETLIKAAKVFHFGSLSFTAEPSKTAAAHALQVAKEAGCIISYDPNYRAALWPNRETAVAVMQGHLRAADIVKLSREEAELLTGKADPGAALREIWEYGPRVVLITDGADGITYGKQWETGFVPSLSVEAIDTTGAGDIFFGTFLREFTKECNALSDLTGEALRRYVTEAARVAALSTLKHGAIASIPDV